MALDLALALALALALTLALELGLGSALRFAVGFELLKIEVLLVELDNDIGTLPMIRSVLVLC